MRRPLLLSTLIAFAACASPPDPQPVRPISAPSEPKTAFPEPRADGRLPNLAAPTGYVMSFDVDPNKETFTGSETIGITLPAPSSYVVLHAQNMTSITARAEVGGKSIAAKATSRKSPGSDEIVELVLDFDRVLPAGAATLSLSWTAPYDGEQSGVYRVKEDNRWYAFTQFESTDARKAFPCFDEPGFKVPFEYSIKVPNGMIAVANTNEVSREGGLFKFNKTAALPTYLVAFAVGDFDIKEATRTKAPKVRIVTTKGKTGLGDLALESTGALVDILGDWFGIPYPFEKLDIVAVPEFAAGAMENPGLITYRSELLLLDPARASIRSRRSQAAVTAHELAHQWFGDLVTAAWWNDIWLNEGMATWMEWHAVDKWKPQWKVREEATVDALWVMDQDGLAAARAVRQPVRTTSEIEEAFDGITYQKGASVLSTIESWVGEDAFQRGIRSYLKENGGKAVTTDKLFSALDRETGKNVSHMAAGYLDRPGVPLVEMTRTCEGGNRWSVELGQEQWKPLGSKINTGTETSANWMIPVCIRAAGDKKDTCAELKESAPAIVAGRGCPTWIHPNPVGSYYRFDSTEKELVALATARSQLTVPERVSLLNNAWASARAGKLPISVVVKLLPAFDDDKSRLVTDEVATILYAMDEVFSDPESKDVFSKYVATRFAKKRAFPAKESEEEALTHRTVTSILGDLAHDDATLRETEATATKWLADPSSVDAEMAGTAVSLASRRAGMPRLEALRASIKNAKTTEDRVIALRALAGFDDEKTLLAAYDLLLTDELRVHDIRYVLQAAFGRRSVRNATEQWTRAHWEPLRKRLQGSLGHILLRGMGNACSTSGANEHKAWYDTHASDMPGSARGLANMYEADVLCGELRNNAKIGFEKALKSR